MNMRIGILMVLAFATNTAYAAQFSDVSADHFAYDAITALQEAGILQGYDDGTFRPEQTVNRAEAVKLIVAPLTTNDQLQGLQETVYGDVSDGAWYLPYIEWARSQLKIIDGPPEKTSFYGQNTVILAEFLKMMFLAHEKDPVSSYREIALPLSRDVSDTNQWYYPYMRYGITSSVLEVDGEGNLNPGKKLTRADAAVLLYRFLLYTQGGRTQELLLEAERNITITLRAWDNDDIVQTQLASARALLAARGAQLVNNQPMTRGAVKVAEAFRSLIRGYSAGAQNNVAEAERLAKEAWQYAASARVETDELSELAEKIQEIASKMAESARQ